jgi:hypothetical protein
MPPVCGTHMWHDRTSASCPAGQVHCVHVTEAVIWRAEDADLAAIARLRREWTLEQDGGPLTPTGIPPGISKA